MPFQILIFEGVSVVKGFKWGTYEEIFEADGMVCQSINLHHDQPLINAYVSCGNSVIKVQYLSVKGILHPKM